MGSGEAVFWAASQYMNEALAWQGALGHSSDTPSRKATTCSLSCMMCCWYLIKAVIHQNQSSVKGFRPWCFMIHTHTDNNCSILYTEYHFICVIIFSRLTIRMYSESTNTPRTEWVARSSSYFLFISLSLHGNTLANPTSGYHS